MFTLTDWQTGRNDRQEVKTEYRKKGRSSRKRRLSAPFSLFFLLFFYWGNVSLLTTAASMQTLFTSHQQLLVYKCWLKPLLLRKKTFWSCSKPHFKASQGGCETVLTRDLIKTSVFRRKWRYSRWEECPDLKGWNLSVMTNEFRPVAEELIRRDSIQKTEEEEPLSLCLVGCHVSFWLFSSSTTKR